jgi:hypothetical protein
MKFSQWQKITGTKKTKFYEFYQFKNLSAVDIMVAEMAQVRDNQSEVRKTPHIIDKIMLFFLYQVPQSLWSHCLSYLQNKGIYDIQQEMKSANIAPLRRTTAAGEVPYLGFTGGTAVEEDHYNLIRDHLKKLPPYTLVPLAGHTFLIVSPTNINPLAYMYMKIDNSFHDDWWKGQKDKNIISGAERGQYLTQGHGLHGEYLNTFDPIANEDGAYQWGAGYRGLGTVAATKWLQDYFDRNQWHHIGTNPHADDPEEVAERRQDFTNAQKNPQLLHSRITQGGGRPRKSGRQQTIPIHSGELLQSNLQSINARRNAVVGQMDVGMRNKLQIEINPGGSNIEIGIRKNYRNIFSKLQISTIRPPVSDPNQTEQAPSQAEQIVSLIQQGKDSSYIAQVMGMQNKKVGKGKQTLSPEQVIDEIKKDKEHDACVYPYWEKQEDGKLKLHNTSEDQHNYIQSMPLAAPEKLVPRKAFVQHSFHELIAQVAQDLKTNEDNFRSFINLYQKIPEIKPEATEDGQYNSEITPKVILDYYQLLKNLNYSKEPPKEIVMELRDAGLLVEHSEMFAEERKDFAPLTKAMEIGLFARAFQYWLHYQKQPPLDKSKTLHTVPNDVHALVDEFGTANTKQAKHILENTHTKDVFDYHHGITRGQKEDLVGGWHMSKDDSYRQTGTDEEHEQLVKVCEENWASDYGQDAIRSFIMSNQSKIHPKNRDVIMINDMAIGNEALSQFANTKLTQPVKDYLRARSHLEEDGAEIDPDTGDPINVDPRNGTIVIYERAKTKLKKLLYRDVGNFARRLLQLDFGFGGRRATEQKEGGKEEGGAEYASDEDALRKINNTSYEDLQARYGIAAAFLVDLDTIKASRGRPGPRSLEDRLQTGRIFGKTLRERNELAGQIQDSIQRKNAEMEKQTGVKLDPDKREDRSFIDFVARTTQMFSAASQEGLNHIVGTAQREKYNELLKAGRISGPNALPPEEVQKLLEEYGRLMVYKHLNQMGQIYVACPNWELFVKNIDKPITGDEKKIIKDMQYAIEKAFFDKKGNFQLIRHGAFETYLHALKEVVEYGIAEEHQLGSGDEPLIISKHKKGAFEPIVHDSAANKMLVDFLADAFYAVKDEVERQSDKKKKDSEAPFRLTLLKLKAFYDNVLTQYKTTITDERKKYLAQDLEMLANDQFLASNENWLKTAKEILRTQHHHGMEIPDDIFQKYAPDIQNAVEKAA